jgi:LmbE family N-acetylglucosaminyl deacetylase
MKNKSIGIIIAHPDDEVLGFGGTILRHIAEGDKVNILFLSTGLASRNGSTNEKDILKLREVAKNVSKELGTKNIVFEGFPDNKMDSVSLLSVIKKVENFINLYKANIIYTHYINDLNIDHNIVSRAVLTASRPLPSSAIEKVYFGETLSSSEYTVFNKKFQPNTYFDIGKYLDRKLSIINMYKDELREWPHPRSVRAVKNLAEVRGSEVGLKAAEAFILVRDVKK